MAGYAELQVTTNYSFLEGASHPHELVETAAALGLAAIGVTDRNSLAGIVRAHVAAGRYGIRLVVGCRLDFADAPGVLCYPTDRAAYGRLARLLTLGKRRAPKGKCLLYRDDLTDHGAGQIVVALPPDRPEPGFAAVLDRLRAEFQDRAYLAAQHRYRGDDARRLHRLAGLAAAAGVPLVATNDVLYHHPARRRLQDVLTCIRTHCTVDEAGFRLEANAERQLKAPAEMARLFQRHPDALARTVEIAGRCRFDLGDLRYDYPDEAGPGGESAYDRLVRLTWEGAAWRYPDGVPPKVRAQIGHELALIARLDYARFFLTVADIAAYARKEKILHQGRGSAANSAVCYVLGITEVDPAEHNLMFERFISEARGEVPDIDMDFEHERREEVIQHIYGHYGRDRAGMTAVVSCYRSRGAIREVGKALGLSGDVVGALAGTVWGWSEDGIDEDRVRALGLDPGDRRLRLALELSQELIGFPRHLSQHPGGFVIAGGRLDELVPIENAAMDERTMIGWDKDDIDALGILKVDILALGMLTTIRKAFALLEQHEGRRLTIASVPAEDPAVYDMLGQADSIGVFQVESRAQQSMLPRLRPEKFYDLVIEVAIVRPGPIQGAMVHPYLRRRAGLEPVEYPSPELREVLEPTLGVPLFQEQAMKIAVVGAGFSPSEADELRRSMATFRRAGTIGTFAQRFIDGMLARGYARDFAERCWQQIQGFGSYGFPEAHAASFALLVYVSAWLKCHYPDVFACAILNSQPMGFYAPAQLIRDAREHGVPILPIDVNHSQWDTTLEPAGDGGRALRLGFRLIAGMRQRDCEELVKARGDGFASPVDLAGRAGLDGRALARLAQADAFGSMGLDRRQALWLVGGLGDDETLPLFAGRRTPERPVRDEPAVVLPDQPPGQAVAEDYAATGLSLKRHPVAFMREAFAGAGMITAEDLKTLPDGRRVSLAGLVLFRQRPGTAKGTIFVTIEDETGAANLIVWPATVERFRRAVYSARLLACTGTLQREGQVIHVIAQRLDDWTDLLVRLQAGARTFRLPTGRGEGRRRIGGERPMRLRSRDFH